MEKALRRRGFAPKLSDAEVMTMEIVAKFFGIDTDKGAWKYFHSHSKKMLVHRNVHEITLRTSAHFFDWKARAEQYTQS